MIVEYSRNGINPIRDQPNSVVRNSVIRHTLWGGISSGHSPIQMYDNHIYDCGHEGIDVQGGSQVVRGNLIEDCNSGIVILGGSPTVENNTMKNTGGGIHVQPGATPILSGNVHEPATQGSTMEWRYGDFRYRMYAPSTK